MSGNGPKNVAASVHARLKNAIQRIREFLMPVIEAVENGVSLDKRCAAETGWQHSEKGG